MNHNCCTVGCDAACRTSVRSSPIHPWFSIPDSKSAMMPYSPPSSTHHLRQHSRHPYQHPSPWLSSIVEHRPSAFVHHHHQYDERRQQQDQSVSAPSHAQNSDLDARLLTQLSPRERRQRDFADPLDDKTQQRNAASSDTKRTANKTSGAIPGMR